MGGVVFRLIDRQRGAMNPASDLFGWAILGATFLGPIGAVLVTRFIDAQRDRRQRRMWVFRALMAYRAVPMNPDRIGALNLIQIEFSKNGKVLAAWAGLMKNYATRPGEDDRERHLRDREHLYILLLQEIGRNLGVRMEHFDILEGAYYPEGAAVAEWEGNAVRRLFAEIATGHRALPIAVTQFPAMQDGGQEVIPSLRPE